VDVVTAPADDPILVRRARYARLAALGQRAGYLCLAVAIVAFVVGFVLDLPSVAVGLSMAGLVGACVVLPPAIVAVYAVKAAEREDRQAGRR
jgi:Na+/proline symporter